jgi:hypothetical protein
MQQRILFIDNISPASTTPSAINYFLENVIINKGLQVLGAQITNSLDIGTYLNVNGNATILGNLNGVAVINYIL